MAPGGASRPGAGDAVTYLSHHRAEDAHRQPYGDGIADMAATASGKRGEVVSRGGWSKWRFGIPDVMRGRAVRCMKVGATNRTHAKDYRQAVESNENTGLLMKVHTSNYSVRLQNGRGSGTGSGRAGYSR